MGHAKEYVNGIEKKALYSCIYFKKRSGVKIRTGRDRRCGNCLYGTEVDAASAKCLRNRELVQRLWPGYTHTVSHMNCMVGFEHRLHFPKKVNKVLRVLIDEAVLPHSETKQAMFSKHDDVPRMHLKLEQYDNGAWETSDGKIFVRKSIYEKEIWGFVRKVTEQEVFDIRMHGGACTQIGADWYTMNDTGSTPTPHRIRLLYNLQADLVVVQKEIDADRGAGLEALKALAVAQ